jgi:hypothetical protein
MHDGLCTSAATCFRCPRTSSKYKVSTYVSE